MTWTYKNWVKHKRGTVKDLDWLLRGCPRCECREWQVTNDGWCYCDGCNAGYDTNGIWTNATLSHFDKNGFHCFMCHGYGIRDGKPCKDCGNRVTQPIGV